MARPVQRIISGVVAAMAALTLSSLVDMTPVIGSPQIDYSAFDIDLPFWPQLALWWVVIGIGGSFLLALAMLAWDEKPSLPLARAAVVAALWFGAISLVKLATFLAWGTMGPLGIQQPVFRFALINGLISAALITLVWLLVGHALQRIGSVSPWRRAAMALIGSTTVLLLAIIALALWTGLPLQPVIWFWGPPVAVVGLVAALLASFIKLGDGSN
ncbi:hypothetical protein GVN24_34680 [Rhizobium sp. CRIBSB]|nr:hypothetical protein [Rhizobium sp. CRIBSB]